jgi:hypothetical protein
MALARFVGIGVGEYDKGQLRLEHAVPDVEAVADLLEESFECTVVDTCYSGEAVTAGELASRIMQRSPPEGEHVWVGVLTSSLPAEMARDEMFGQRLARPSGGTITLDGLAPGAYTIDVTGPDPSSPYAPVSSDILIWGQEPR